MGENYAIKIQGENGKHKVGQQSAYISFDLNSNQSNGREKQF